MILLAGCASATPPRGGAIDVVWHRVEDPNATCRALSGRVELYRIRGCSKWNAAQPDGSRVCAIYAPMPRNERDREAFATLGHELLHCFDGPWHDHWGRMNPEERKSAAEERQAATGR